MYIYAYNILTGIKEQDFICIILTLTTRHLTFTLLWIIISLNCNKALSPDACKHTHTPHCHISPEKRKVTKSGRHLTSNDGNDATTCSSVHYIRVMPVDKTYMLRVIVGESVKTQGTSFTSAAHLASNRQGQRMDHRPAIFWASGRTID